MRNLLKHRQDAFDQAIDVAKSAEEEVARQRVASVEDLLEHLRLKYPDTLPRHQMSDWVLGSLKGHQDVLKEIELLLKTANQ